MAPFMDNRRFISSQRAALRGGFTLIELLTVIAIIGILAAILIPTVGKVRENARFSKGTSNLREWARANILFAQDNRGVIPHDGGGNQTPGNSEKVNGIGCWWNELPPYIGSLKLSQLADLRPSGVPTINQNSVFICPNAASTSKWPTEKPWLCYAPSFGLSATGGQSYLTNVNKVKEPSRTVLFAESTNHAPGQANSSMFSTANCRYLGDPDVDNTRWKGKALVSFFDGSVKSFKRAELYKQYSSSGGNYKGEDGGPIWDPR